MSIFQKDLIAKIQKEYPFSIIIHFEKLIDDLPQPFFAKTFEKAYKYSFKVLETYSDLLCHSSFIYSSLKTARNTGLVWKSKDSQSWCTIECNNLLSQFGEYQYKYFIWPNKQIYLSYRAIIKVNEEIITLVKNSASIRETSGIGFAFFDLSADEFFFDFRSAVEFLFDLYNLELPKNLNQFINLMTQNQIFLLKDSDFDPKPEILFREFNIISLKILYNLINRIKRCYRQYRFRRNLVSIIVLKNRVPFDLLNQIIL